MASCVLMGDVGTVGGGGGGIGVGVDGGEVAKVEFIVDLFWLSFGVHRIDGATYKVLYELRVSLPRRLSFFIVVKRLTVVLGLWFIDDDDRRARALGARLGHRGRRRAFFWVCVVAIDPFADLGSKRRRRWSARGGRDVAGAFIVLMNKTVTRTTPSSRHRLHEEVELVDVALRSKSPVAIVANIPVAPWGTRRLGDGAGALSGPRDDRCLGHWQDRLAGERDGSASRHVRWKRIHAQWVHPLAHDKLKAVPSTADVFSVRDAHAIAVSHVLVLVELREDDEEQASVPDDGVASTSDALGRE